MGNPGQLGKEFMTDGSRILDNQEHSVVDHLRDNLWGADVFRLVSAYFSIYGYELLAEALNSVDEVRFLFGDPGSVGEVDPGRKDPKTFSLTEQGNLTPKHVLRQKALALACAQWIGSDRVKVRSISRSNFLHGKMYLTDGAGSGTAVVGSSNFTQSGLGGGFRPNLEINLATSDADTRDELREWFDKLWRDRNLTADVKQLERIDRFEKMQLREPETVEVAPDEQDFEEDDDFIINRARHPYRLSELDLGRWRADLERDRETLDAARRQVEAITPERDGKLAEIRRLIRDKVERPASVDTSVLLVREGGNAGAFPAATVSPMLAHLASQRCRIPKICRTKCNLMAKDLGAFCLPRHNA